MSSSDRDKLHCLSPSAKATVTLACRNTCRSSCKCLLLLLSKFKQNCDLSTNFSKTVQYEIQLKMCSVILKLCQVYGQTDEQSGFNKHSTEL